jgi:hypothetical protein
MLMAMRMLKIFSVGEHQEDASENAHPVSDLIRESSFQCHTQENEKEAEEGGAHDPGKTVLLVTRNEGQGRCKKDDDPDDHVHPARVGINAQGREKKGNEGHEDTMNHAGR